MSKKEEVIKKKPKQQGATTRNHCGVRKALCCQLPHPCDWGCHTPGRVEESAGLKLSLGVGEKRCFPTC